MKQLSAVILIITLSSQFLYKTGLVGYYSINKEYIATILCINKAKPEMHCDGKCYLKKQVEKADDVSKTTGNTREKSETFLAEILLTESNQNVLKKEQLKYPPICCKAPTSPAFSIFQPPELINVYNKHAA